MAKTLGIKLFSGHRAVNRFFKQLDLTLHEACDVYFSSHDDELPPLPKWLYARFQFVAVGMCIPTAMTTGLAGRHIADEAGASRRCYKVAISVPYHGSRLLLRTAPVEGFVFPYVGRIGRKSFHVISLREELDATEHVARVAAEIERVREGLHGSHAMVADFNDRLRSAIDRKVRTYW